MTSLIIIVIIVLALLISIPLDRARKKRLQKYWLRSCTGPGWRQRFPDCPKEEIRSFLEAFVDAFAFSSKKRIKFNPDDKVMDVYRALYPPGSAMDMMELETFAINLEEKYGFDLSEVEDHDITLGRLFEMTRNPNQRMHGIFA